MGGTMAKFKRILVAVDFSPPARDAIDVAIALARDSGAKITLLYVVEPVDYASAGFLAGAAIATQSIVDEHVRAAKREIERLRARKLGKVAGASAIVRLGRPADEIVAMGGRGRSSLIVIGTHGRSGIAHLL